jgi:predicted transcriptional regulator
VTRRDLLDAEHPDEHTVIEIVRRPPVVVYEDSSLRDAADQMVIEHVGRLPVVRREALRELVGIVSRSDLLAAHAPRLEAAHRFRVTRPLWTSPRRATPAPR